MRSDQRGPVALSWILVALSVVAATLAACDGAGSGSTTSVTSTTAASTGTAPTTTEPAPTTRSPTDEAATTTSTAVPSPATSSYAVVAEERARRLTAIGPRTQCDSDPCTLEPTLMVELGERPHNLAAVGSVVFATHPGAGAMSRVDFATGEVITVAVGVEPHDVKYDPVGDVLYVADEAGRRLLTVAPATLEIVESLDLPGEPHDLSVGNDGVWITMIGRDELARVNGGVIDLFPTGRSPHDLIVDSEGRVWFSNWGSDELNIFDPATGDTAVAPAGVIEPHHFAIGPDGSVWVTDNGGNTVTGFIGGEVAAVVVGPVPHHVAFIDDIAVVAVSGSGQAVFVLDGRVVARATLTEGLHGVAVIETAVLAANN